MIRSLASVLVSVVAFTSCQPPQTPADIDLAELTIAQIHAAYTAGDYTAEQLVEAYLARIEALDQSTGLNAIVLTNPDVLAEARAMDEEFQQTGVLRPLHGIPMIVKDNYNTIGLQTAAGSVSLKGFSPATDAYQVRKLKEAGAIIIAKSNMAEWAFSSRHTESSLAGTTRNPYNLEHVPAGSSGGTAAAVASNFGAIGLGTDTGNSIRGPSSHNALVGFRSTIGLTSREGIVPLYLRNDIGGPMCRTVEDATRVLEVIAGYDPADPVTRHSEGQMPGSYLESLDENGLQGARIGVLRALSDDDPHPEVRGLFEQAIADISSLGAEVLVDREVPVGWRLTNSAKTSGARCSGRTSKPTSPNMSSGIRCKPWKTLSIPAATRNLWEMACSTWQKTRDAAKTLKSPAKIPSPMCAALLSAKPSKTKWTG